MQKLIETTGRPRRQKLSYIPESVVEFFEAASKSVSLNHGHPDSQAQYSGIYRYPVTLEDLGEDNADLVRDLKTAGFQFGADGTLKRGDCLLYWTDIETRNQLREDAEIAWHEQSVRPNEESAERINDNLRRKTRGQASITQDPRSSRSISDHVKRGGRGR